MFSRFKPLVRLCSQITRKCEFQSSFLHENLPSGLKCDFYLRNPKNNFHTDTPRNKRSDLLEFRRAQKDAVGKLSIKEPFEKDILLKRQEGYFPTVNLPDTSFDGVLFKDLPVVYIQVSRNNTIMSLFDNGKTKLYGSCGTEGFKNARKGTNVAAQTTGTSFGMKALKRGFKTVRVVLNGLGPGRLSSIKGIQLSGLNVISITDNTKDYTKLRPRKQRRL